MVDGTWLNKNVANLRTLLGVVVVVLAAASWWLLLHDELMLRQVIWRLVGDLVMEESLLLLKGMEHGKKQLDATGRFRTRRQALSTVVDAHTLVVENVVCSFLFRFRSETCVFVWACTHMCITWLSWF